MKNRFSKIAGIILMLFIVFSLYFVASCQTASADQITIILTNDIHGDIAGGEAFWVRADTPPRVGGFAKFATYMKQQRSEAEKEGRALLYLDGGDWLAGTPESDLLDGRPLIAGLNATGLDYAVFGNHEVDLGIDTLKKRIAELDAPVLAANLRYREKNRMFPGTIKWIVEEIGEMKIGLFGLAPDYTPRMTVPELVENLIFLDEIETARKAVDHLQNENCDIIIALTHIGLERDERLAGQVDGIDIIAGGHTHDLLWEEVVKNNTIIIQAGGRLRNAGRLNISIDNGTIVNHGWKLSTLYGEDYPPDKEMQALMDSYLEDIKSFLNEPVGRTSRRIEDARGKSSPLGNLITDVMREKLGTDLAFMNPMGVLDSLPEGEVTRHDLMRSVRFGNHLVKLELTGKQINTVFERSLRFPDSRIQFSGAAVEIDTERPRWRRVNKIKINGEDLEDEQLYSVTVSNYVAARPGFIDAQSRTDYPDYILWEIMEEYFLENPIVEPPLPNRYREAEKTSARGEQVK